jgi:hypothetical protein
MSMPFLAVFVLASLWGPAQQPAAQPEQRAPVAVNPDALTQKEFLDRVAKYLELRDTEEKKLPKLSDSADPKAIAAHKTALLKALQRARNGAKQGDIFTPPARALIRRHVAGATAKPGSPTRAAIQEENPGKITLAINGEYPTSVPLPTVPPQVLAALPRLPDEQLEFRFLGTRLILLDNKANMVVDFMDRALS